MCYNDITPPAGTNLYANCPPAGADLDYGRSAQSHVDPMVSFRWKPIDDVMFRASLGTGYRPPSLAQITRQSTALQTILYDPQRGYEAVGQSFDADNYGLIDGYSGGNANIKPEKSTTFTAGVVLTPRFVPNLRFSADWTRIVKRNNFFDPLGAFIIAGYGYGTNSPSAPTAVKQLALFEQFLQTYPDRVKRGPPSDGYAVGPITFLDLSLANYVGTRESAIDFNLDYWFNIFDGRLDLHGAATWTRQLDVELLPGNVQNFLGVGGGQTSIYGGYSALPWRGNASVRWSKGGFMIGAQLQVFDRYYLNLDRSVDPVQGAAYIPAQAYQDITASYEYDNGITIRLIVRNVTNKIPPRDMSVAPLYYSRYGDPLGRNFQLSVSKTF